MKMTYAVQITRGRSTLSVGPFKKKNKAQAWKESFEMHCCATTSCACNVTTSICQARRGEFFDIEPYDRNESIADVATNLAARFLWKKQARIFRQNHAGDPDLVHEISSLSPGLDLLMHAVN